MNKKLNTKIQFVKVNEVDGISNNLAFRVKQFGENESILIIDKKATVIKNIYLSQDTECYKCAQKVQVSQFKR